MATTTSPRVLVLGGTGMLGSIIVDDLAAQGRFNLVATARDAQTVTWARSRVPQADWKVFDAQGADPEAALESILSGGPRVDWIINAIGIIKPLIKDDNASEVERAIRVNSLLPHLLARRAEVSGARVLQIATDCVYSGVKGMYVEADAHDPLDVYGKSKSMGEVHSSVVHHLRCSIIGPEGKGHRSLLDWFRGQAQGATLNGFTNHRWNGVTTLHYGRLCAGIITANIKLPHLQHIVPTDTITKHELLVCFAKNYNRADLTINPTQAKVMIDRTLQTSNDTLNRAIWAAAGYTTPPTVPQMVEEMAKFNFRFAPQKSMTC